MATGTARLGRVRALAVGSATMSERPVIDADHLPTGEDKARAVRAMFDAIAPRYDLVNRIMTFRMDVGWRRRTVRDLVDLPGHLYPVGRLDRNSTGLILLTNDGELANRLTHPRYEHPKVYSVQVVGQLTPEGLAQWQQGMLLDGEMTAPAEIKVRRQTEDGARLRIVMREGRKRQIRRVAALLGLEVRSLHRTAIGPLHLGDLKPGEWRRLTAGEVAALRRDVRRQEKKRRHGKPWHDKRRENANLKRRRTD